MAREISLSSLTDSEFSRLFRLINDSLHPFTESENISLSKEEEKDLLLILSQVSNEIRRLIRTTNTSFALIPNSQNHQFLSKAISHLITLLTFESRFIQHLAGNALGKSWEFLIHSLCICFEFSISNISSCSFEPAITGVGDSDSGLLSLADLLKPKLKNASFLTAAGIIRILRNILKFLKEECDDELVQVFLDSVSFCISNVPWDSMDEFFGGNGGEKDELRTVFLGNFIQFLCSLVEQFNFVEGLNDSLDKHAILSKIINFVPKLLYWCLGKKGVCVNRCMSRYFRHKLLVLMIRLSFQIPLDSLVLVSWLQLLHNYFQEVLCQPLTEVEDQDGSLEDSPFMSSISDGEVHSMHSCHLQRQAIFLFLRCSFSLINPRKDTGMDCPSATVKSGVAFDANSDLSCCGRQRGLLELYSWISEHLPVDMLVDQETYMEKCVNFSRSFIKLYVHEDDLLFKLLLQLLSLQACEEQQFHKERWASQDVREDVLFHVSNIFNPIHLFHLFLAELHYDHQVLLDYLISKDTGINCAEYLLRCLRKVCDSWQTFTEFSVFGEDKNQSSSKRRKVLPERSSFKIEPSAGPAKIIPLHLEKKFKGDLENRYAAYAFERAKDCLLSLKKSVENLHLKNLFPYNPVVLLKRLTRFQELCFKQ
ncbi:uncharacterized protein LOC111300007 isoform X2 [Durio zibethinus]|uniref:Uncharacterized protein LOC111300007 isoform X2 n=1 Tax=Durio zibethinus TaxID=66656 RepID=A0A6P5ZFN1_DURZI|nr:uncharacterized protein LOC111300007 isoform X2 [Durio zibethinus]